jgi:glycosyltransferase involved in cell wall biosynthesis
MRKSPENVGRKVEHARLRVLLATGLPPPAHGGIINWTRLVRRELEPREDLELFFVDTSKRYKTVFGMPRLSRLWFGSWQALRVIGNLIRALRAQRPDVLHLNTSGSYGAVRDLIILKIARMFKVPVVAHYHMQQPPVEIDRTSRYWRLLLRAMSQSTVVVMLDKKSEAIVREALPGKKVSILPTMVPIDDIDALRARLETPLRDSAAPVKIIFVGFIAPVKGVRELVKSCARLKDRNLELNMVGKVPDPALRKELEKIADTSGKAGWLRFRGEVDHEEVLRQILTADLLVLPSHAESAPAVLIEGMGCGKPVIGTATGAVPEMLDIGGPQECGICVPPRDVDALTGALERMIDDPKLREACGCKGRQRAEQHYTVPVGCRQLVEVWRSVVR